MGDALLQKTITTDFIEKTRTKNDGSVPQYYVKDKLTEYDESMVRKYIDKIKVYEDKFTVCFKAGVDLDIER